MIFASMKSSQVFGMLFKRGKSFHADAFVCFFQSAEEPEVGFVASKKVGNAVKRNYARRRLREIFRAESRAAPPGRYALVAKKPVTEIDFGAIREQFGRVIKQISRKYTQKV
ncbi:MAG: ribonuclease P protein component [Helicobacteraceae bacterium]|jgi:ribonuclease P protein component|nr:ribonuclease P protein component [Helicobacteraceae bacterium]